MNPYETLGVAKNADDATIKKAYHKLVMKYHPDKNAGDKKSEEKFKEINNAFDTLKDPQKRAAYDRYGDAAFASGNGASAGAGGFGGGFNGNPFGNMGGGSFHFDMGGGGGMDDIIREAMRGFGFDMGGDFDGGHRRGPTRGRDLLDEAVITLRDAYFGTTHNAEFTVGGKRRKLEIKIPAGANDGARLRVAGQGEPGQNGAPAGDFYVDVRIMPDRRFVRDGNNLYVRENVPFATLALGGEIEITTIGDKKLSVNVSSGTQIGERLRVRGHGMPIGRQPLSTTRPEFGDLYIEITTSVPTRLNDKQKQALREFVEVKDKKSWF